MKKVSVLSMVMLLSLGCGSLTVTGCDNRTSSENVPADTLKTVTRIQGKTMGTYYAINVVGGYKGGEEALRNLAESCFKEIVDKISTFDKDAELYRLNEHFSTEPYEISEGLSKIIQDTLYIGHRIENATDITVGPLVNLWGFGKDKRVEKAPSAEEVAATLKYVGLDKFELKFDKGKSYIIKSDPHVRIDLATVGEGLGADAVAEKLLFEGYRNFMVNVAGASRSFGVNDKGHKWKVGIEDPSSSAPKVFAPICTLDKAVTTAGSYRNFFKDDASGKVYSHAIDPKTGYPVSHSTLSVTVIADSAYEADALDTGLLVLGADKALLWGRDNNYAIATIELVDGKPVFRYTDTFKPFLDCGAKTN